MNQQNTSPTRSVAQYRLDLLTFAVSGLRDGLGPLLGVFLIQKTQWDAFQVSTVLATAGITNLILQIPAGFLYDTRVSSFLLVGLGGFCLAASCLLVSLVPPFVVAVSSQVLVGIGSCLLSVGLPALSLQAAHFSDLRQRLARNEIFSKMGNFCSIGAMGYVSQKFNLFWMFYVIYLAAAVLIGSCLHGFIVDKRGSASEITTETETSYIANKSTIENFFSTIICDRSLWPILVTGFLYQFANASMFMIFEQQ